MKKLATALLLALSLGACSTSEAGFERVRKYAGHKDIGREIVSECIAIVSRHSRKTHNKAAVVLKVAPHMAPSTYCRRVVAGLASGRLTAEDWNAMTRGNATPNLVKVVGG